MSPRFDLGNRATREVEFKCTKVIKFRWRHCGELILSYVNVLWMQFIFFNDGICGGIHYMIRRC